MQKRPILFFILAFVLTLALTQFLAYQQYKIIKEREHDALVHELNNVKDKFRSILYNDIAAANTLAIIYKQYGIPKNFDSVASQIMENSKYVDAIQFNKQGIITNVYPLKGHENTIGMNTLADSMRRDEEGRALQKQEIYFAGPRQLREGGIAILGKVPVVIDDQVFGLVVVLTRLSTITKALNIEDSGKNKFAYVLSKNTSKNDSEKYPLTNEKPGRNSEIVSVIIPEGDWRLDVAYHENHLMESLPVELSILGIVLSIIAALFAGRIAREPYVLNKIIDTKTRELATSEKYFRTLIESSTDAIVLINATGHVIYQTPSTEKISGYSLQEIQSMDGIELIHPDDRVDDNNAFMELTKTPGAVLYRKHRLKNKNGQYIWIEGTYQNLLHDENVNAIVYVYADITEKIWAEEKLLHTKHLLGERVKELSTIYELHNVLQDEEQSVDEVFTRIVNLLPPGWQYPEICEARVVFNGKEYRTLNYKPSPFFQRSMIHLLDGREGFIEVVYTQETKPEAEGAFLKEERALIDTLAGVIQAYFNKRKAVEDIIQARHLLGERVKELSTIYELHNILEDEEQSIDGVFIKIVNILPPGWQYPKVCEARIVFNGKEYQTLNYKPSPFSQQAPIKTQDGRAGFIEVIYTEGTPLEAEGPFLKEERDLINTIVEIIQVYFNKKSHQHALEDSEARFRGAFEHAAIGMTLVSIKGERLQVNEQLCNMLGYTEQELLTLTYQQTIHPDDREKNREYLREMIEGTRNYYRTEIRYIHKKGLIVWVNLNLAIIKDSNLQPLYFVSQVENITEKKAVYNELIRSEANIRSVFDNSEIMYLLLDTDYNIVAYNKQMQDVYIELTGHVIQTGDNLIDIIIPEKKEAVKSTYDTVVTENKPITYESAYALKNGTKYYVAYIVPISLDGVVNGICISSIDITDRKKAFLELQRSEANLRSVFDNSDILYYILDTDYNIVSYNQRMQDIYVDLTGHVIKPGDNMVELVIPEKQEGIRRMYNNIITKNKPITYETTYNLKDGPKYFMVYTMPISLDGFVKGICVSSIEITKIKNLEFEREKIITDLLQRNRDLEQFAFIVSHNVRGPLSSILGLNNLLKEEKYNESLNFIVEGIGTATEKLDSVLWDLNEVLHVRNDVSELKEQINFNDIIANVKESINQLFYNKNVNIECDFNTVSGMLAIKSYMKSIFFNLMSNSIKFANPNITPIIKIWTEHINGNISLYFRDNGMGIDTNRYSDRIFGLYHRFHPQIEGKGLGLYMTKTQVELMNGKIEVESELGLGTTFHITLPV